MQFTLCLTKVGEEHGFTHFVSSSEAGAEAEHNGKSITSKHDSLDPELLTDLLKFLVFADC
jgi:hypothetical protein